MFSIPRPKTPTVLASGGALLATIAVGLFSVFPKARPVGFAFVIVAGVLFWASRHKPWLRTPLDELMLLLLLQIGVSFWATALPGKTWVAVCQLGGGLVAFYAVVNWTQDRGRLWWAVAALIVSGLGLALVAPFGVDWFRDRKTFLPPALYHYFPLLLSDSIHPNVMAGALATLIPLPLALLLALPLASKRRLWRRGLLLVVCLVQIFVLILTKSRGGYLALGAGLWLTLWLSGRRRWAIILTLMVILLVILLMTRPQAEVSEGLDPARSALDASTWAFRMRVWHTAIQIIGDFPFTGVGLGTFNDVAAMLYGFQNEGESNPQAQSTNLYIQVAVDLGLFGLILYLAILLLVLWMALRAYGIFGRQEVGVLKAITIGASSGILAMMIHGLVDTHTWGSKGAFIPWMVMGLVVALYRMALSHAPSLDGRQEMPSR